MIRLPAYSPDLNLIEGVWRWMKRGVTNTAAHGVEHLAELVNVDYALVGYGPIFSPASSPAPA
ncbi:transposase [Micromonospora sp. NPDC005220]|uniref:transposase n=1 Tax=Micromonospora sp. NPDC005220 TaxID=3155589 RepID=UPI0033B21EBF